MISASPPAELSWDARQVRELLRSPASVGVDCYGHMYDDDSARADTVEPGRPDGRLVLHGLHVVRPRGLPSDVAVE